MPKTRQWFGCILLQNYGTAVCSIRFQNVWDGHGQQVNGHNAGHRMDLSAPPFCRWFVVHRFSHTVVSFPDTQSYSSTFWWQGTVIDLASTTTMLFTRLLFYSLLFSGAFMGHSRMRIAFLKLTTTRTLHCSCSIGISNRLPQEPWSVLSVDPNLRPRVPCGCLQSTVCGLVRRRAVLSVLVYPLQTFGCARGDGGWDGGRWRCCFPPKVLRSGVPKTA